jgi:hypothetical protein
MRKLSFYFFISVKGIIYVPDPPQAGIVNSQLEKRLKQFDKTVADWKAKADSLTQELEHSQARVLTKSEQILN